VSWPRPLPLVALAALAGFAGLTAAVAAWPALDRWDSAAAGPQIDPTGPAGQILAAAAILTNPYPTLLAVLGLAWWCWRQRLRRLAGSMAVAGVIGTVAFQVVKVVSQRPRPDSAFADTLTYNGWAYPSGHLTTATILAIMAVTVRRKQRGSGVSLWGSRLLAAAAVVLVGVDRWAMRAHWATDIAGGILLGVAIACGALAVGLRPPVRLDPADTPPPLPNGRRAATDTDPDHPPPDPDIAPAVDPPLGGLVIGEPRHVAVIYNPTKIDDLGLFRRQVDYEMNRRGWLTSLWAGTTLHDLGGGPARQALDQRADLIIAAGGDGTVRAVCSQLVGHPTPLALIPSGTGNILARNLGLPLDQEAALTIACDGRPRPLDLIRVTASGCAAYSIAMSGMGIDAAAMAGTRTDLKRLVGNAAYVVSIVQQLGGEAFELTITLDGHEPVHRRALTAMIGNVGGIQGPIQLFPAARPDDGLLDLLVSCPTTTRQWAKVGADIISASLPTPSDSAAPPLDLTGELGGEVEPLEYAQGRRVRCETESPITFQVDGDAMGVTTWLEAEVVPAALQVVAPRTRSS
jgi:diacylglycerol kinase family enzyme/membrane-associated phospholipid phosphatase